MTPVCATIVGIALQLLGAAYLVIQSWNTSRQLGKYSAQAIYDNFAALIETLAREVGGQFKQQLFGFTFVLGGSALQLYAAIVA